MTAKTLMIQGTASSVGKSLLVAALCRSFRQDGLRVAPFKSQNMALNSFVTRDGGEMGRAQVVQALAAGLEPSVEMNPILLKPEADHRSQVIVLGRPRGSMGFRDYRSLREEMLGVVEAALGRLRATCDLVIIEGAGSPAEINLKAGEIVNMRIAKLAHAPVVLVGDIDRGGVFAHLVGTLELLEPDERARVKGILINKFRGDVSLLQPGLEFLEQRTGVPVLGVIPYLKDLRLPEEDSVALEERRSPSLSASPLAAGNGPCATLPAMSPVPVNILDIAVVALPHISNFDDFDPLAREPGVLVRYVASPAELGRPDMVILPGTKTTIADLGWLRERGLVSAIQAFVRDGGAAIGICGGYQMLGHTVEDAQGIESAPGATVQGLHLLPLRTTFEPVKQTHQVCAVVLGDRGLLSGCAGQYISGYEIHMGRTTVSDGRSADGATDDTAGPAFSVTSRSGLPPVPGAPESDGLLSADGRVLGTYLHGLFDSPRLRRALLHNLATSKGLPEEVEQMDWGKLTTLDDQLDQLAAAVRSSVDIRQLYDIAGVPRV